MPKDTTNDPARVSGPKKAVIYRMVMPDHLCPYGLKSVDLLKREGFKVDDNHLETREQTDAFKREHGVDTTPQTWIDGERVGGFDDLQVHLGKKKPEAERSDTSYQPIIALFSVGALLAVAFTWFTFETLLTWQTLGWFISISMVLLGPAEAQGHRVLLDHVPELRPAGQALGALRLRLPLRGDRCGPSDDGDGLALAVGARRALHRHGGRGKRVQGGLRG